MNPDWGAFGAAIAAVVIIAVVLLIASIVVTILSLLTMHRLLNQVSYENRKMQPGLVWLNLIPLFSVGWIFYTVVKIRDSVRAEYASRGLPPDGDFGFVIGLTYAVVWVISVIFGFVPTSESVFTALDWINLILSLVVLALYIAYWVKCARMKNELMRTQPAVSYAPAPQYPGYGSYGVYGGPGGPTQRRGCPSCGAVSEPGDDFCRSCGSRFDASAGVHNYAVQDFSGQGPAARDSAGPEAAKQTLGEPSGAGGATAADGSGAAGATCPFCGATYRPQARFCRSCGRPAV